jgi:hypothetical protein
MENLPDIAIQLTSDELFFAFKKQLAKDFEQSNCSTDFVQSLEPDYEQIVSSISAELRTNENKTDFSLEQLLYQIDISEAQIKRHIHLSRDKTFYATLVELIVKRVLQKVVIRQHYKNRE